MTRRAVALFSGGLDSMLAIRVLQLQDFEVEALNIQTTFSCCRTPAAKEAAALGVRLTVVPVRDDYVELIRSPRYGYGKGMNPCIDCRIYMCQMAKQLMEQCGACVVITGEIVGQRPMSQKRWQQHVIENQSGLKGRLLRPLSAKLLAPTIPELEGRIDREKLYAFQGRGRKPLVELARKLGIEEIPQPSTGCALTEVSFAPRVRDLVQLRPKAARWEFELLRVGRHFRIDPQTKIVVGRNEQENAAMLHLFGQATEDDVAHVRPENFLGPDALVIGRVDEQSLQLAGALVLRYTKRFDPHSATVRVSCQGREEVLPARPSAAAEALAML